MEGIMQIAGAGLGLLDATAGNAARGKLAEKQGFQNTADKLLQIRQQRESQKQQKTYEQAKTNRTLIIAGSVFLAILIIVLIIYKLKKSS